MESSRLRAWSIGAIYFVIALAGSLIASAPQVPFLAPYVPVLSTIVTVGAVLRAFIDRTLATVSPKPDAGDAAMDAVRAMPGVAEALERGVSLASPLPAGPTQLHDLASMADDLPAATRNFSPAVGGSAPFPPANPRSQRDRDGRYLVDDPAALARAQAQEEARLAAERAEAEQLAREQAEQELRRQAKIAELKASLAALEGGE